MIYLSKMPKCQQQIKLAFHIFQQKVPLTVTITNIAARITLHPMKLFLLSFELPSFCKALICLSIKSTHYEWEIEIKSQHKTKAWKYTLILLISSNVLFKKQWAAVKITFGPIIEPPQKGSVLLSLSNNPTING